MRPSRITAIAPRLGALALAAALSFAGAGGAAAQDASAMSCGELWYARNAIYAEAGYCFRTGRAISVFGRRCHPPYGHLSGWARQRVNEIQYWEGLKGCGG